MDDFDSIANFAAALGIGLWVGLERERRKGQGKDRSFAGLRTFTITSLLGYVSMLLGGELLLAITLLGVTVLAAIAYFKARSQDPGLTTEIALLLVLVLGGLCSIDPALAIAFGVVLSLLLTYRQGLHHFVRTQLSEREVRDGLILATAALVIMPLVPDRFIGPFAAINLRTVWTLTVLIMAVGAAGHVAMRLLGTRNGLAITGIASGFASSAATIAVMGSRARKEPALMLPASTAAILSSLATLVQMSLVLAAVSLPTLELMWLPLSLGFATTLVYALIFIYLGRNTESSPADDVGGAFSIKLALLVAVSIAGISMMSAALLAWFGQGGVFIATVLGGFADTHAPSASVASLVAAGQLPVASAVLPILAAMSSNACTKCLVAWTSGGTMFSRHVIPGQILLLCALWGGAFIQR
ncbi:MgtC/SapB family protein [Pseudomonas sp. UMAB-08]|uniref:MgtC/SapB family protein n=1 Tax=Pseudomonas sp. UMAB-08 TaxID=1365375 RepID=UPI001C563146|nr:MgtC/SapB family protein [Pseudomonas sp. UMAB-08]